MNTNDNTTNQAQPTPEPREEDFATELLSRILPNADAQNPKPCAEPRHTAMDTPCARSWDVAWVAKVDAAEQRLQHRICGARMMSGNPCTLESNHENGRCRFHGGFALTGAAPGNRNAVIHALYSRRLRVCDTRCPQWRQCPCAGPDIQSLPETNRPTCPYEQTEYNTALTDALDRVARNPHSDGVDLHIAHNLALLQVMMTRAALALRNAPLVDTVTATRDSTEHTGAYQMQSTKPSAHLEAFTRIAREYRHCAAMLQPAEPAKVSVADHLNRTSRTLADTDLDPDRADLLHPDAFGALSHTQRHMRRAIERAAAGDTPGAVESFRGACRHSKFGKYPHDRPNNGVSYPDPIHLADWTVKILRDHIAAKDPPE